ncbi:MAG: hypothetical protein ABL892_02340 [Thiobacillaceae bacterium]
MKNQTFAFLLTTFLSGTACALGLGDLTMQSHLGEPLRASVKVLGAPKDIQPDCFSVQGGNDGALPGAANARVALETRADETTLFITTSQAVNDPVLQMTLIANCADRLQRGYVVLLDPPANHERVNPSLPTVLDSTPLAQPHTQHPARERIRNTASRNSRLQNRVSTVSPRARANPSRAAAVERKQNNAPVGSRLILSGGRYRHSDALDAPLALRLDMSLPDVSRPHSQAALSPTDLSDENTSLTHKLAHLETQLVALQARNNALEAARAQPAKIQPPPNTPSGTTPWSRYLMIGLGLLAGGVALSIGLRRLGRKKTALITNDDASDLWLEPTAPAPVNNIQSEYAAPVKTEHTDHLAMSSPLPDPSNAALFSQSPSADGTEVKEDILDQAEVYVAHGRSNLAIHMLQEHLRIAPTESPIPWLLLLDLLARDGLDAEYRATSIECKAHFNVNLSEPGYATQVLDGSSLEAYPHVMNHLQKVWGTPEAETFLTDLIYDHRGGTRQGFDPGAYRDLVMLRTIALEFRLAA